MAVFIKFENSHTYAPLRLSTIPVVLGRSSKAGLQLQDSMCSGQHMSLQISPEGYVIVSDLNSTNGTYINETLISMAAKLYIGDIVRVGDTKFYIDESSLTPKEKSVLVSNSNKTSFTTIGLPKENDDAFSAAKSARRKAMGLPDQVDEKSTPDLIKLDDDDDELGIDIPAKPNQKLAMVSNEDSDEALFELGESSGNTKMIKLDNFKSVKKKTGTTISKTSKVAKGLKKQKPTSGFLSKVKSLFGKDD
ncbi:MAG: hypothetical protein COW01_01190 [Bdellovibrionales bacterium CG12_big_fil_rev_8_21_14_0_65_38_15]|nr:MAG: hypothetical protein COW79_03430 [Bdellovibrionales bacterium CG22_combo_CG10-13_8_21_14_all_38_13]PIQ57249.1 MAG: hypothetical protein COW01_01190 [Bdellovibrionales bacterium CG12_big_fil_rev_8_21_14_0_65_38_15]PIR29655.1 MAG: hypothetical protein COV38_09485 [Bdellovibrionales bacterium CG11_big_fil_rev_8_21_14_0_20_38_13]